MLPGVGRIGRGTTPNKGVGAAAPAVPIVANQSLSFGRLTLSGAGAASLVNTGATITSITLGTRSVGSNHFTTSGATIVPSAVPSDAQYVWTGCTATAAGGDSATFTLTINTEANVYSAISIAEVAAACGDIATGGGKTIKCRSGSFAASATALKNRAFTSEVTLTSYTALGAVFASLDINNTDYLTVDGVTVYNAGTSGDLVSIYNTSAHVTIQNCLIYGASIDVNGTYTTTGPTGSGWGINALDGTSPASDLTIKNNEIHDCLNGIKWDATGTVLVQGNYIHNHYEDGIKVAYGATTTNILDNVIDSCISGANDKNSVGGDTHADGIQFLGSSSADWTGITIARNRIIDTLARCVRQGIFMSDMSGGFYYSGVVVKGNLIVNQMQGSGNGGLIIDQAKSCEVYGNTLVSNLGKSGTGPSINVGGSATSGTHIAKNNVSDVFTVAGSPTLSNNITLGSRGATNAYSTAFDGPTYAPTSLAEAMSMFDMLTAGILDLTINVGAVGSGYVTWAGSVPGSPGTLDDSYTVSVPAPEFLGIEAATANVASTRTYSGKGLGTAHDDRLIVVGVYETQTVTGVTIAGVTATKIDDELTFSIWAAEVPSGTSGNIVTTYTGTSSAGALARYAIYPATATALDFVSVSASTTNNAVGSNLEVAAGGIAIYFGGQAGAVSTFTTTWSGSDTVVQDDTSESIEAAASATCGHILTTVSDATLDMTMAASLSGSKSLVAASWGAPA